MDIVLDSPYIFIKTTKIMGRSNLFPFDLVAYVLQFQYLVY